MSTRATTGSFLVKEAFDDWKVSPLNIGGQKDFSSLFGDVSASKEIAIDFSAINAVKDYFLVKDSGDPELSEITGSSPMSEDQFWLIMYALVTKPKLGARHLHYKLSKKKRYVMHVLLDCGKIKAFKMDWNLRHTHGPRWYCCTLSYDRIAIPWSFYKTGSCAFVWLDLKKQS